VQATQADSELEEEYLINSVVGSYRTEWNTTLRITASHRTLVAMHNQTAFHGMLQGIVELASIVLRPELLDVEIERQCKRA